MKILIAETPEVGKTTLSKKLSTILNYNYIEMSPYIETNKLYDNYNDTFNTYEFNARKIRKSLKKDLKEKTDFIIDTHTIEAVKCFVFDYIFVIRLSNDILYKILQYRGYKDNKIKENIECEIFNVVGEK